MKWHENYDLHKIVTSINVKNFHELLCQSDYDKEKTRYIIDGFRFGFSLDYQGKCETQRFAPNLKIRVGSKLEMWNKVMKEVEAGRYAGPYEDRPPFTHFLQSPIGLVPKDKGTKTRLIFHLSYPRDGSGTSVNEGIPKEKCRVKYPDIADAVKLCLAEGRFTKLESQT